MVEIFWWAEVQLGQVLVALSCWSIRGNTQQSHGSLPGTKEVERGVLSPYSVWASLTQFPNLWLLFKKNGQELQSSPNDSSETNLSNEVSTQRVRGADFGAFIYHTFLLNFHKPSFSRRRHWHPGEKVSLQQSQGSSSHSTGFHGPYITPGCFSPDTFQLP